MKSYIVLVFVYLLVVPLYFVFAHGTGVSYEESKDGYKIDIGHDEFIAADESVRFDFALFSENLPSVEGDIFTDVWVTFTQDKKIFFAGGVHKPEFGTTGFTYVFPKEGTYTVSARFQKDGETVVKTEFPLTVIPSLEVVKQKPNILAAVGSGVGLLFGTAIGFFIGQRKNKII